MGRIHILPPNLVNKIAAGEVIERPASVLKELVENSLDAGATRIDIAAEEGGKRLVRVADDGVGMDGEDLALAVCPHATSKLSDESDLFAIHTLGFRGEALASIGSVSQMRLVSRPAESEQGFTIEVSGGTVGPVTPAGAAPGTAIEVRNLFFNMPARRKFLRADSTEAAHLSEALARIALAQSDIHFRMTHNGKLMYDLPATESLVQRVADVFGAELADGLLAVELEPADDQSPAVRGLIAPPQHSRQSAKWQYVFVNGRYVRDRYVQHAVRESYRGLMDPSRQPVVFLFLLLPAELVDVNAHPTKIEVRFADSNRVHSAVLRCLREKLTRTDLATRGQAPETIGPDTLDEDEQSRQERIRQAMAEFFRRAEPVQRRFVFEPQRRPEAGLLPGVLVGRSETDVGPGEQGHIRGEAARPEAEQAAGWDAAAPVAAAGGPEKASAASVEETAASLVEQGTGPTAPVIQIHNTYLVSQVADGLIIVDQHAMHERVIYEALYARLTDPAGGGLGSQRLLIPQRVTVGARQQGLLLEHDELLGRLGLELAPFGRDEIAVSAFPALLGRVDPGQFVADLADRLADEPPESPEAFIHQVLDMMACKAAVKAGEPLSPAEINALLAQRELIERGGACPHGRPTAIKFSLAELERQFRRR